MRNFQFDVSLLERKPSTTTCLWRNRGYTTRVAAFDGCSNRTGGKLSTLCAVVDIPCYMLLPETGDL